MEPHILPTAKGQHVSHHTQPEVIVDGKPVRGQVLVIALVTALAGVHVLRAAGG